MHITMVWCQSIIKASNYDPIDELAFSECFGSNWIPQNEQKPLTEVPFHNRRRIFQAMVISWACKLK